MELIVDSFAGGGGASLGIEMALGRSPDIAINHDAEALAMHRANHPGTAHLPSNVWKVDPVAACGGRPVGLLWASPDCKHHSKAKGGKPVKRSIRDLAWVVVLWAKQVRPRVIILENVEEFRKWGPVSVDGIPCKERAGQTFDAWVADLRRLGYRVEWRELRACDYGAPTIRKRLFVVARRDGRPIVWPAPTHGDPKSDAVLSGRLPAWRTAAEIIDWSIPCPSIFLTREEGRAVGANRPLAVHTMARIAKGVKRYVIDAAKPFIVPVTHQSDDRVNGVDEPLRTVTTAQRGEHALVTPFITKYHRGATGQPMDEPLATVTSNSFEKRRGGAAPLGLVMPHLSAYYGEGNGGEDRTAAVDEPVRTITTENRHAVIAPTLVNVANGQTTGRGPNTWPAEEPLRTITAAPSFALVAPHLVSVAHGDSRSRREYGLDEPVGTQVGSNTHAVVAPVVMRSDMHQSNAGCAYPPEEPLRTITTGGGHAVLAPFLVPRYGERPPVFACQACGEAVADSHATAVDGPGVAECPRCGETARIVERPGQEPRTRSVEEPLPTVVTTDNGGALAAVHLQRQFGASVGSGADEPVGTVTAGGGGKTALIAAAIVKHNFGDKPCSSVDDPLHTVTTQGNRFGLVSAFLAQHNGERGDGVKAGRAATEPVSTVTATGTQQAVVAAFLAQHNTDMVGHDAREPVSTIVGKGCTQAVVSAGLVSLKGSDRRGSAVEAPAPSVTAQGWHLSEVRAFLVKYFGTDQDPRLEDPLHTVTTKDRFGLVTVMGALYRIVDIGMRMLSPRELFGAQGFPAGTIIDRGLLPDGTWKPLTKTTQVRLCGNSVCPPLAMALVAANYVPDEEAVPRRSRTFRPAPLFDVPRTEAAE